MQLVLQHNGLIGSENDRFRKLPTNEKTYKVTNSSVAHRGNQSGGFIHKISMQNA